MEQNQDVNVSSAMKSAINFVHIIIGIHENIVFFSIAVCMELMAIPNGMISYSPDMTAPYSVDTVATYTCNSGFRFVAGSGVGDQMRTCTEVTESESTVVSGATFGGMAPSCEPVCKFNCTHQVNILNIIIISYSH